MIANFLILSLCLNFLFFAIILWQDRESGRMLEAQAHDLTHCEECGRVMDSICHHCERMDFKGG